MRILLVGEYSRLHNSLKEGLKSLGHEVVLVGAGDGFKNYPVDIHIDHSYHSFFKRKLKVLIYKLSGIDLGSLEILKQVRRLKNKLSGFDVVQLINEKALMTLPKIEQLIIEQLIENNDRLFLMSCGIDHNSMSYMMSDLPRYSAVSPLKENRDLQENYKFELVYLNEAHKKLHEFIVEKCQGIIASDLDYHLPYSGHPKYLGVIPNPINTDKLPYIKPDLSGKIRIFHGINLLTAHMKGSRYFTEALEVIGSKYRDQVEIITVHSLPYADYIKSYESCHILLDQIYSYDQGYNALEAMARGKVVFTGAEKEWREYFDVKEDEIAINALPDTDYLVGKLEWLIKNKAQIGKISENARAFIEKEHEYTRIAKQYVNTWLAASDLE